MNIQEILEDQEWTFAKTMASTPHAYVFKKAWNGRGLTMPEVAKYIREYGYAEKFYNKEYWYIDLGDYKYWTMDYPLEKTDLINRCKKELRY